MEINREDIKLKILHTLICKDFPTVDKYGIPLSVYIELLTSMQHDNLISDLVLIGTRNDMRIADIASIKISGKGRDYYHKNRNK